MPPHLLQTRIHYYLVQYVACCNIVQLPKILEPIYPLVPQKFEHPVYVVLERLQKGIVAHYSNYSHQSFLQTITRMHNLFNSGIVVFVYSLIYSYLRLDPRCEVDPEVEYIQMTSILLQLLD